MSKVIIFSRQFPAYHPKAGLPTFFVEQIYNEIYGSDWSEAPGTVSEYNVPNLDTTILYRKCHTIRKGSRFKVGDKFSPRVWAGAPYRSKQIIIAPDIEVKKVWGFEIAEIDGRKEMHLNSAKPKSMKLAEIAANDGLDYLDFIDWFKVPFAGQIICWSDKVIY